MQYTISFYNQYGKEGLKPKRKRTYGVSFKLKVLEAIDSRPLKTSFKELDSKKIEITMGVWLICPSDTP